MSLLFRGLSRGYPDEISFSVGVTACCEKGRWQIAIELCEAMKGRSLGMNEVIFAELARACANALQWKAVLCIVDDMCTAQCEPDSLVLTSTVNALESGRQMSRSLKALVDVQFFACYQLLGQNRIFDERHSTFEIHLLLKNALYNIGLLRYDGIGHQKFRIWA